MVVGECPLCGPGSVCDNFATGPSDAPGPSGEPGGTGPGAAPLAGSDLRGLPDEVVATQVRLRVAVPQLEQLAVQERVVVAGPADHSAFLTGVAVDVLRRHLLLHSLGVRVPHRDLVTIAQDRRRRDRKEARLDPGAVLCPDRKGIEMRKFRYIKVSAGDYDVQVDGVTIGAVSHSGDNVWRGVDTRGFLVPGSYWSRGVAAEALEQFSARIKEGRTR